MSALVSVLSFVFSMVFCRWLHKFGWIATVFTVREWNIQRRNCTVILLKYLRWLGFLEPNVCVYQVASLQAGRFKARVRAVGALLDGLELRRIAIVMTAIVFRIFTFSIARMQFWNIHCVWRSNLVHWFDSAWSLILDLLGFSLWLK